MFKLPGKLILKTRLRLIGLLVAAAFFCGVSAFHFIRYLVKPFTGLVAYYPEVRSQGGWLFFTPRLPDSPAIRAGLVPNRDWILAIGGRPISTIRDLLDWEARHFSFEPVEVTAQAEGQAPRTVVIKPQLSVEQSDWFFILFFIVILGGTAVYILTHYHQEITHNLFAFMALFYMAYTCVQPFYYESPFTIVFVNLGEMTSWFILIFLAFFQRDILAPLVKKMIVGVVSAVCLFFTAFRFWRYGVWFFSRADAAWRDLLFVGQVQNEIDIVAYVLFLAFLILIYFRTKHAGLKHHIEWITAGTLLALPPHFFFNQLPLILQIIQSNPFHLGNTSNFFLSFLPLSYIIGLARARGYRFKILQNRTIVYIIVAFAILALFSALYHPVQLVFTDVFKLHPDISGFIVALSLFITALYLQLIVFVIIDHRLLREKRYEKTLEERSLLRREADSDAERLSQRNQRESELLIAGLTERSTLFLEQTRKACQEMQKLTTAERTAGAGQGKGAEGTAERLFGGMRKQLLDFERFNQRFEALLPRRASIRISFSLDTLVDSVVSQCRRQWSGLVLRYQRQPGLKIFCSPEEISLCLFVVIENAWQALARPADPVTVSARPHTDCVTVEIADPGSGIPLKNIPLLGQPFFTTKRDHDGLGLFLAKTLLERNDGFFSVEAGAETGTRVLLHIPTVNKLESAGPERPA